MRDLLITFYLGETGAGSSDRTLEKIWQWKWERLENEHDYIQWLFPLTEKSSYNPMAPVLTQESIERFRTTDVLKSSMKRSFNVMLDFWGLQLVELANGEVRVDRGTLFGERGENWIARRKHNHLRLTRVLASTRILGLEPYSRALFQCLDGIYQERQTDIPRTTYEFWKRAVTGK